jgi:hypothetical protein
MWPVNMERYVQGSDNVNKSQFRRGRPATGRAGFSAAEVFIALVALAVLGTLGWYVLNVGRLTSPARNTAQVDKTSTANQQLSRLYKNDEYGFSFRYPASWKLAEDMHDAGRGHAEGEVTVTAPRGIVVSFRPNLGGKGGSCVQQDGDVPHQTANCATLEVFSIEALPAEDSPAAALLYLYTASFTPAGTDAQTSYEMFIENGAEAPTETGPIIGAVVGYGIVHAKVGYVDTSLKGGDNTSSSYFGDPQVKQAAAILRSFKLAQ